MFANAISRAVAVDFNVAKDASLNSSFRISQISGRLIASVNSWPEAVNLNGLLFHSKLPPSVIS